MSEADKGTIIHILPPEWGERFARIETKLDSYLEAERLRREAAEKAIETLRDEHNTLKINVGMLDKQVHGDRQQLSLLKWMFVILGAPVIVALAIAGLKPMIFPERPQIQVQGHSDASQ